MPRVLVACEESQAVTIEFRKLGIEAYSCDIQDCSGGHPEWHITEDAILIANSFRFYTQDRVEHFVNDWDMMIAFPPCTHLAVSGSRWFEQKSKDGRQQSGIELFMEFTKTKIKRVAIENPVSIMSSLYKKPTQIIQPWMFGHPEQKPTCLWLRRLPRLNSTDNVYHKMIALPTKERQRIHHMAPSPDRGKERSKTFPGIAKAMAEQWGSLLNRS